MAPYSSEDCKSMLKAAIRDPNPVVFLENEILYGKAFEVSDEVLDENYVCPVGKVFYPIFFFTDINLGQNWARGRWRFNYLIWIWCWCFTWSRRTAQEPTWYQLWSGQLAYTSSTWHRSYYQIGQENKSPCICWDWLATVRYRIWNHCPGKRHYILVIIKLLSF